jgi:hypothetical protein
VVHFLYFIRFTKTTKMNTNSHFYSSQTFSLQSHTQHSIFSIPSNRFVV